MGRRGRAQIKDQTTFFVTSSVKQWEHLFDSEKTLGGLREIIREACHRHGVRLHGYVLMPNHFHLLLQCAEGGPGLSRFMRDIKSLSARLLFPDRQGIWMARFDDLAILTERQFWIKLNYIHGNPVRAGLVQRAEEYEFSSAKAWLTGRSGDL